MKRQLLILVGCLLLFGLSAQAQTEKTEYHNPKKAAILSAIIPGAGQIYNGKWWKTPIVYAGLGTAVYSIHFSTKNYKLYRDAYILRTDGDPNTVDQFDPSNPSTPINQQFTEGNLRTLIEYYQRNRDLSYIATAAVYLLQIVDANVDAHLYNFDVSDDLSLKFEPAIFDLEPYRNSFAGLRINISLK